MNRKIIVKNRDYLFFVAGEFMATDYDGTYIGGYLRAVDEWGRLGDPEYRRYTPSEIADAVKEFDGLNHTVIWED